MDEAELLAGCSDGDPLMAMLQSSSHLSVAQTFGVCVCIYTDMWVCIVSCACVYENSVCTYIVPWCLYMHGLYIYRERERLLCVCVFINSI